MKVSVSLDMDLFYSKTSEEVEQYIIEAILLWGKKGHPTLGNYGKATSIQKLKVVKIEVKDG